MAGRNIFLSGPAGVGKSHLIGHVRAQWTRRALVVTATTGIAAVAIEGETVHKAFALGQMATDSVATIVENMKKRYGGKLARRWREASAWLVDEVSMLEPRVLQMIDQILKLLRGCPSKPFGGIQVIAVGDFHQLPPVAPGPVMFAFEADAWKSGQIETIQLTQCFRQKDAVFVNLLNRMRTQTLTREDIVLLHNHVVHPPSMAKWGGIQPTELFCHRVNADEINMQRLRRLDSESHLFDAEYSYASESDGMPVPLALLQGVSRTHGECACEPFMKGRMKKQLELRVGAQVILIHNIDSYNGLVNGSKRRCCRL